ncbi:MAG: hypothetical protein IJN46_04915, partial [Lachnospiraceae bacterium]|nr:hypothetical protein [Lachnospiraceae bacterium]
MKTRRKKSLLLTVILTIAMVAALSFSAYAAQSDAVSQDGLTAQLFTDKDAYEANESVAVTVRVDNQTGKEVSIVTTINVPESVKLANERAAYEPQDLPAEAVHRSGHRLCRSQTLSHQRRNGAKVLPAH